MQTNFEFLVSKIFVIDGAEKFNIHVEHLGVDSAYHFADIFLPSGNVWDSMGFSLEELQCAVTYCKEHFDELYTLAKEKGYGDVNDLIRQDYL